MPPEETVRSSYCDEPTTAASVTSKNNDDSVPDGNKQYLFVIRHGDRWDYSYPEWKELPTSKLGDSPLSPLGHTQARQVGTFLNSYLQQLSVQDLTWMSSPFLRCLQTSNDAIQEMTRYDTPTNYIPILPEYSIFEWDGHDGEWHKDLPPLEERKHYFPRLDLSYEPFFIPTLPEPRSAFFDRCQRSVETLHHRHPYKPKQALVMVSHAAGCIALAKTLTGRPLTDITPAGPCSIYMFTRTSNTTTWTIDDHDLPGSMNGYTGHLAQLGTATKPWNNFGDGVTKFYTGPPTSRFHPEKL